MSDETRTVTVESLAAALRKGEPGTQPINMFADPFDDADADDVAAAIFAALPVATAGPDLREALRDFVALLPPDRWPLLRPATLDTLAQTFDEAAAALRGAAAQADGGEADGVDAVYAERNHLVAALAHLLSNAAWRGLDPSAPDFTIVYIDLPSGQVSWHIPDAEMGAFPALALREPTGWDGHDTDEKYRRLAALRRGDICRDVADAVVAAVNKERAARLTDPNP